MQDSIIEYVAFFAKTIQPVSPIYEFGSRKSEGDDAKNFHDFFPNAEYTRCDAQPGRNVDRILNLHSLDLPDESIPTILCMDTLEHVESPRMAVEEMRRVLREDGILLISSVMNFPIHNYPNDYWRFTPEGFRSLLASFPTRHIGYGGTDRHPREIIGIGWKRETEIPEAFLKAYNNWHRRMNRLAELFSTLPQDQQIEIMNSQK